MSGQTRLRRTVLGQKAAAAERARAAAAERARAAAVERARAAAVERARAVAAERTRAVPEPEGVTFYAFVLHQLPDVALRSASMMVRAVRRANLVTREKVLARGRMGRAKVRQVYHSHPDMNQ